MNKINLVQVDIENWLFTIYESKDGIWFGNFTYSPQSFIDLSMLIEFNESEKLNAQNDRQFLINLSFSIRNNYQNYLSKSLDKSNFIFND
jgi:hypothetical protein